MLHKLCSILSLLKELLPITKLLDSSVLQLTKTMLDTFGVDNIQLLQLKALGVVCTVCANSDALFYRMFELLGNHTLFWNVLPKVAHVSYLMLCYNQ